MVLLILSKGAQRRKSGEKRKDRKKEATEEEKGCPEKEKLVPRFLCLCRWTAVHSAPALCNSLLPLRGQTPHSGQVLKPDGKLFPLLGADPIPQGGCLGFPALVATPAAVFMCFLGPALSAKAMKKDVQRLGWRLSQRGAA